jgi:hypothetical protein
MLRSDIRQKKAEKTQEAKEENRRDWHNPAEGLELP